MIVNLIYRHLFLLFLAKCDPDTQFTCKVSGMCHDKGMTCNGVYDCRNWYGFSWDDDSDESTAVAGCGRLQDDLFYFIFICNVQILYMIELF